MSYLVILAKSKFRLKLYMSTSILFGIIGTICNYNIVLLSICGGFAVLVFAELFYSLHIIDKKRKNLLNEIDLEIDELEEHVLDKKMLVKIFDYKKYKMIETKSNLVVLPIILMVFSLVFYPFESSPFLENPSIELFVVILIVLFIFLVFAIYSTVKEVHRLNSIDSDISDKNFETIKGTPEKIIPLYIFGDPINKGVGFTSTGIRIRSGYYASSVDLGYAFMMKFENKKMVLVLFDYPGLGYRKMRKAIKAELLNQNYNFKYLKNSRIVISGIGSVKKVFK